MPNAITWTVTPEKMLTDLSAAYVAAIRAGVRAIADRRAPEIEAWMKQNRPWQDITGVARASLYADVIQLSTDMVEIFIAHGAYYGVFLELKNAGKYAIIAPALDVFSVIVWRDVLSMMR